MGAKMKPICKTSKMIGPAYTVKLMGKDSFALYKALEEAAAREIIMRAKFEAGEGPLLETVQPLAEADMVGMINDIRMGIAEAPKKKNK